MDSFADDVAPIAGILFHGLASLRGYAWRAPRPAVGTRHRARFTVEVKAVIFDATTREITALVPAGRVIRIERDPGGDSAFAILEAPDVDQRPCRLDAARAEPTCAKCLVVLPLDLLVRSFERLEPDVSPAE